MTLSSKKIFVNRVNLQHMSIENKHAGVHTLSLIASYLTPTKLVLFTLF